MNWSKFFLAVGTVLCLPLYIYFRIFNIDPATGFFLQKGFLTVFYYTILTVCLAGAVVFGLWGKPVPAFAPQKKRLLAVPAVILGLLTVLEGFSLAKNYLDFAFSFSSPVDAILFEPFSFVLTLAQVLLAACGAFGFFACGIHFFWGSKTTANLFCLFASPVWMGVFTAKMFMEYPQIASFPDRALWFTCLVFFTLFLVGQSRIMSGLVPQKGCRYVTAFGTGCALTGTVLIAGTVLSFHFNSTLPLLHLLFVAAAAGYALLFLLWDKPQEAPSSHAEE